MKGGRKHIIKTTVILSPMLARLVHCGIVNVGLFIRVTISLVWNLWVDMGWWAMVYMRRLKLRRVGSRVCGVYGSVWSLLVGGRESLV